MGRYDDIAVPISGQPVSSGNFGIKVRDAIIDLDYRLSTVDTSTGTGKAFSTAVQVLATTTETASLTITGMTFVAGIAYEASMRCGIATAATGTLASMRLRKTNAAGADWGEYFRFEGKASPVMSAISSIFLINNTQTDVVSDVCLTAQSSVAAANALNIYANANSPRYLVIKPAGFASDYVGMGVQVS